MDWKTCPYISFNFVKLNNRTHLFFAIQIRDTLYPVLSVPLKAWQRKAKAQTKLTFIEVETAIKINFSSTLEQLHQRHRQPERVIDYGKD